MLSTQDDIINMKNNLLLPKLSIERMEKDTLLNNVYERLSIENIYLFVAFL